MTPSTSGKIHCQQSEAEAEDERSRGATSGPSAVARPRLPVCSAAAIVLTSAASVSTAWSCSRTSVTSSKKRGSSRVSTPRGCGRSIGTTPAIRPGRGDITTTRVERKTASEIECVTKIDGRPRLGPDPEQLEVEALARHLVERPERLVHQQQRRRERERAGDRDALLHAAGELPRVVASRSPSARRARPSRRPCAFRFAAVPLQQLERQGDVLRDRAPVVQHRRLEDDPVVAVEPGARRPACR